MNKTWAMHLRCDDSPSEARENEAGSRELERGRPRWGGRERGPAGPPYSPSHLQHAPFSVRTWLIWQQRHQTLLHLPALWLALSPSRHPHHKQHQQPAQRLCSPCLWAAPHTRGSESASSSILTASSPTPLGCLLHGPLLHLLTGSEIPSILFSEHHLCLSSSSPLVTTTQDPPFGHFQSLNPQPPTLLPST